MLINSIRTADVNEKKVLVRADFNVPLSNGKISDDTRIKEVLPTINFLLDGNAKIILMSHLGRPGGEVKEELKMNPVAEHLSAILKVPVKKLDDCIGPEVKKEVDAMKPKEIILLENTRFHKEEEACDSEFSKQLADLGEVYVVDSVGTSHRKHASTYGISEYLPAYAGFLMEKEVFTLSQLMKNTPKPLTIIMGGAKIDTKIGLIKNFLKTADHFLIGGGLANTFLAAQGYDVGESLYEPDKVDLAREIMLEAEALKENFVLPEDVVVVDEIKEDAKKLNLPVRDVMGQMKIVDIGEKTIKKFEEIIESSGAIIWNGPMGLYEMPEFSAGTKGIAELVSKATHAKTLLGGGDTVDAIHQFDIDSSKFTHVSTGGGAMLEFLEGQTLPGVEIILRK